MSDGTIRRSAADTRNTLFFAGGAILCGIVLALNDAVGWGVFFGVLGYVSFS